MSRQVIIKTENPTEIEGVTWNVRKGHSFAEWDNDLIKELTEKGIPYSVRYALYEEGGSYSNTGEANIVAGFDGEKLKPSYVFTGGHLANGTHAQFNVYNPESVFQVHVWRHHGDITITILNGAFRELFRMETTVDRWQDDLPIRWTFLTAAIAAAVEKSQCYHCRSPHYVNE